MKKLLFLLAILSLLSCERSEDPIGLKGLEVEQEMPGPEEPKGKKY